MVCFILFFTVSFVGVIIPCLNSIEKMAESVRA